jgi:sulfide:quinone oxidoreductase
MSAAAPYHHVPLRVLVAGGGVAGLETCFALDAFAGDRVHVTLMAPNAYLEHRPVHVHDPLAVHGRVRIPLARLARAAGAELRHDRIVSVDPAGRRVRTAAGYDLTYDILVLAVGGVPEPVLPHAEPLHETNTAGCRVVMQRLREGRLSSLAFVEPIAPASAFDLYDLAIHAAALARQHGVEAELALVTAEPAPLAILGVRAAGVLGSTLGAHGLRIADSAHVRSYAAGELEIAPLSRRVPAEAVVAAPRLAGPWLDPLPCDGDGFLPVDGHGRVAGVTGVLAAGDCTPFPVRHPSLAAQQADAVAAWIAADAGSPIVAEPFAPVLRGILPSRLRWYVEAPLTGGQGDATRISALPLWSPELRFHARFLGPFLVPDPVREGGELAGALAGVR